MLLVVYARVVDNKKKGLTLEGPFYGPECKTMHEAHEECRKIVTPSKDHVLVKVFDLDELDYHQARAKAKQQFDRIFDHMEAAQGLCDAPKRKRKK